MTINEPLRDVPRCDYEGSTYQRDFWNTSRQYEDQAERIALKAFLPPTGRRIIEIGAGAGRLGDLYLGYDEIYLLDYAKSQMEQAHERWGHDPRFTFVQGDIYNLPFPTGYFDTVVTVRVLHHVKDLDRALGEIKRIVAPRGLYITEFANKRNLKAIGRYLLKRGKPGENPFTPEPFEFVPLNIDFHPKAMRSALEKVGFVIEGERSVSFFRLPALKKYVPASLLAGVDGLLQRNAARLRLTPSIFLKCRLPKNTEDHDISWRCPHCMSLKIMSTDTGLECTDCHRQYQLEDGIYLFRD